ncbi:MAG TPA: hypothetical protein VJ828_10105 [Lacipirellulaceae bacterium]|nr:hypothetical protein [Lacipirellulaceae bacterium]
MPSVDAHSAAAEAIEQYDKDGDAHLNDAELAACPAINNVRQRYDKDGDRQVSEEEIAQRLEQLYSTGTGLLEVRCTVTRGGRPLANATVRFVPEPFLADALQTATGTTDSSGLAMPGISADQLPENLTSAQLMQVGLYRVEIEHPTISPSGSKPLGFEVDPSSRDGTMAQVNL